MTATRLRGTARLALGAAGLLLGVLTVPVDLAGVAGNPFAPRLTRAVMALERYRLGTLCGAELHGRPAGARALGYLALRVLLGLLAGVILALIGIGVVVAVSVVVGAATGGAVPLFDAPEPGRVTWTTAAALVLPGALLCFLAVQGLVGVIGLEARAWNLYARPGSDELEQRVVQLTSTRIKIIDAIDDERRRIERDLHDGVQQRVIALGILLGRAERAGASEQRDELHRRALAETGNILSELREVSMRIYPAMLARDGLHSALEALVDRTPVPIRLDFQPTRRAPRPVESACYFTASEAVTNVIKHASAHRIDLTVTEDAGLLRLVVRDDGCGGADPAGHGLSGIASRITAIDGTIAIDSPVGGPTTIRVEVPCG